MERLETRLEGPVLVKPVIHGDERGFFHESYRRNVYAELGIPEEFVQDNHSRSSHGIVRGMHFQVGQGMAKLVRCARGAIVDVVVDLRRGSPTFGEWEAFELNDENLHQLYCPIGFAHGFCVLSERRRRDLQERGLLRRVDSSAASRTTTPTSAIAWPKDVELVPSQRDANAPLLRDIESELPFVYERSR